MQRTLTISAREARRFMLSHLLLTKDAGRGEEGVMRVFERVNCLQFDPLSVAGRSHDIALQARVEGYTPLVCESLLYTGRKLLDAWDKKASIIRTADRPGFARFHAQVRQRLGGPEGQIFSVLEQVRAHIRANGPTTAKALDLSQQADWWFGTGNWGSPNLGRVALEAMLSWGELAIAHKNGGRKAYDFAEAVLPQEIVRQPDPHDSEEDYADWRVLRRVGSAGLMWKGRSTAWMGSAVLPPKARNAAIDRLLDGGQLLCVQVEGVKLPFLARAQDWARYESEGFDWDGRLRFIAPLDNLMWDRQLLRALFGFDYHWEVYEPPEKRKFGYYVLPILAGDALAGRIEPVLKKGDGAMRVKGLWWEAGIDVHSFGKQALLQALDGYARFLGAEGYVVEDAAKAALG